MENILQKYRWPLRLVMVGLGALLTALSLNNFIASRLAPFTVPQLAAASLTAKAAAPLEVRDWGGQWRDAIVARCFFGCPQAPDPNVCPEGCPEGQECQNGTCVVSSPQVEEVVSDVPVASDLPLKLLGAMVADRPQWSRALMVEDRSTTTFVVSVGDVLPQGAEVVEVRRDRVILSRNGRLEFVRMDATQGGNPGTPPNALAPRPPSVTGATPPGVVEAAPTFGGPPADKAAGGAVSRVDDTRFQVNRSAMEKELADPAALARQARIIPNYKDGERSGLKLVGISPNSVYSQLGIRSGDVIHSVNGVRVNDQNKALEMLDALRREKQVNIEVERRGQKQTYEYQIR